MHRVDLKTGESMVVVGSVHTACLGGHQGPCRVDTIGDMGKFEGTTWLNQAVPQL